MKYLLVIIFIIQTNILKSQNKVNYKIAPKIEDTCLAIDIIKNIIEAESIMFVTFRLVQKDSANVEQLHYYDKFQIENSITSSKAIDSLFPKLNYQFNYLMRRSPCKEKFYNFDKLLH